MFKHQRFSTTGHIRLADGDTPTKIVGRAIAYNTLSRDLGGFKEQIAPGAFTDSINGGLVCALLNHDTSQGLGTQKAGTLRLTDGPLGLDFEIDIPDTSYARDAVALLTRGDSSGVSFGFNYVDAQWSMQNTDTVCTVTKGQLGEISILTGPAAAYAAPVAQLRTMYESEADYGIDIKQVAKVFLQIKHGLPLDKNELATMQEMRSIFSKAKRPALEAAIVKARQLQLI